jgi:hypothetical protein
MCVYIIPIRTKMTRNSEMCLRSVLRVGIGGGEGGLVTPVPEVLLSLSPRAVTVFLHTLLFPRFFLGG